MITAPNGLCTQARGLLDSAFSTSFISENLTQLLRLSRSRQLAQIAGVGGVSHQSLNQSLVCFTISPLCSAGKAIDVEAVVLPKITCDLPLQPVAFGPDWQHLIGLRLADPDFGIPGKIDVLLGVDVVSSTLLNGRRHGPLGSPSAIETSFGWVLAGTVGRGLQPTQLVSHHTSVVSGDDLLHEFWEVEELNAKRSVLTAEEQFVVNHFNRHHCRDSIGRFIVPLPRKPNAKPLGESRSSAVYRFSCLERSLRRKKQFDAFKDVIEEYFDMSHAEPVPTVDLSKQQCEVFYLPIHAVMKESSTTTKIRAVFDASAKSSSGVSLNDQLLVGPTVHPTLVDVLLRFRLHRIALTSDVSRMYRAVLLPPR